MRVGWMMMDCLFFYLFEGKGRRFFLDLSHISPFKLKLQHLATRSLSSSLSLSLPLSLPLWETKKKTDDSLFQGGLHKKTRAFTHPHKVPTHLNKNGTRCGRHFYAQDQRGEPRPPERRQEESQKQTGETPPIR